MKEKEGEES
jgi:hypothetical protein